MNNYTRLFLLFFITATLSTGCATHKHDETHAEHSHGEETSDNGTPGRVQLSPDTTELLIEEMRELQNGMKKIVPALVAGEWEKISYIGNKMEDSYIMKDSLTKAQMHELHESLPEDFQKLDHAFHESAGLLAKAADNQNREQISYYYYKMTEACVECHSLYATHKFPQFLKTKKPATK